MNMSETDLGKACKKKNKKKLPRIIVTSDSMYENLGQMMMSEVGKGEMDEAGSCEDSSERSVDEEITKMAKINSALAEGLVDKIRKYKSFTCAHIKKHISLKEKVKNDRDKLDGIKEVIDSIAEKTTEGKSILSAIKEQFENNGKDLYTEINIEDQDFFNNFDKLKENIEELSYQIEKLKTRNSENELSHNIYEDKNLGNEHCKCNIFN